MAETHTTPGGGKLMVLLAASTPLLVLLIAPVVLGWFGRLLGFALRKKTEGLRAQLVAIMDEEDEKYWEKHASSKPDSGDALEAEGGQTDKKSGNGNKDWHSQKDWDGIIGFFHPFCNAGGGGERVLWAAIRATQDHWPKAKCVVYTGDHEVDKAAILHRVKHRFNIQLHAPTVQFLYLSKRHWVLPSSWPHFTLLGQSLGSMVLAWDAFSLLVPDIFIDTMGYAFALGLCKFLFRKVSTAAYVHYPTISTDMLESLDPASAVGSHGVNAGKGAGMRGLVKKTYWRLFASLYSWVGSSIDVVMTNSSWTQAHVKSLWGPRRLQKDRNHPIAVVYPPVAVRELEREVEVSEASEANREQVIVYIAQFRPEKDHELILQAFSKFSKTKSQAALTTRLVLIGSVRDDQDSKKVYQLRLLANELGIKHKVEFHLDASWPEILDWLRKASVGVNGMWNEHFGIGVVEYQAAGLISVVHNSGGPKLDIVIEVDGLPTGYHATNEAEFAEGFEKALSDADPLAMRKRARRSATRFTEEEFARKWVVETTRLVALVK
ncbi:asparagine-linked glycosylation protein [Claviceps citrina]|nr:asparagine-linked glycosylation protein [Claviceps citrina]